MAPRPAPRFAAPSPRRAPHIAAPRVAMPRPEFRRGAPPRRPAPHLAAPSRPSPPSRLSERPSPTERIQQRAQQRQQLIQQRQQTAQQRQRETLSRQTAERQTRIDRLQQRVQQLQSQKVEGARAQRVHDRALQAQNRLLQREQRAQQADLARQQRLGLAATTVGVAAATTAAAQAAQRERFAAHFREQAGAQAQAALVARQGGWAPRHSWRRGHRAVFVAWLGPVFWPYAYSDIFDYTFWSYAYEPSYWAYAYDDFVDTVFWDTSSPYSAYASIYPGNYPATGGRYRSRQRAETSPQAIKQLCGEPDKGVTAWPLADIARAVRPNQEQRALLDDLKTAAAKAADVFKDSCTDSYALTPPGRLRSMLNRISATLEAIKIVRPALENFYNSLSDEQQARFNALGPHVGERSQQQQEAAAQSGNCGDSKSDLAQLPINRIEASLHPAGKQKDALERLSDATTKAIADLQAACPNDVPLTPVGRLEAMQHRLEAMQKAARLIEPALDEFYATLSSEQKARFNTLQQVASH
ncbi:Spy/CpxP family protein refolding chaperone [Bradyrhizobium sp. ISRA443]|uniref:Spy/CpxP family protein refolding chaperone n=1 Tax=unclassified Bradyrhizobium TaxID=2631580 RepID=UPI0024796DA4|nr:MULTISPECIES: Spy/CpxP family protein refolding chaperone [unclassified Bradyrhizobium]WGS01363.1 Spy/CpxP family protein refolding chaperone [Bradyrhizobium sp. ISRA436]WGS08250.1 Spy/CpxP family protein refolding chaperone [Bradyrhizobium sp. ISRA437]WGS15138.1 Spy/CpxP family protein refolding chaperone [Bradyrhizobium sp. ISRA443]